MEDDASIVRKSLFLDAAHSWPIEESSNQNGLLDISVII
jgi:hypothetical protein